MSEHHNGCCSDPNHHHDVTLDTSTLDLPKPADPSRRSFLQGTLASGAAAAALGGPGTSSLALAQTEMKRSTISHYSIPATAETVHWGYFSKSLTPLVEVQSASPRDGDGGGRTGTPLNPPRRESRPSA